MSVRVETIDLSKEGPKTGESGAVRTDRDKTNVDRKRVPFWVAVVCGGERNLLFFRDHLTLDDWTGRTPQNTIYDLLSHLPQPWTTGRDVHRKASSTTFRPRAGQEGETCGRARGEGRGPTFTFLFLYFLIPSPKGKTRRPERSQKRSNPLTFGHCRVTWCLGFPAPDTVSRVAWHRAGHTGHIQPETRPPDGSVPTPIFR